MTVVEAESVFFGGKKVGVLVRAVRPDALQTMLAFVPPSGELVRVRQEMKFSGSPREWSSFSYSDSSEGTERRGTRENGRILIDGEATPLEAAAIPSYGSYLLLRELLSSGGRQLDYLQFDEGTPMRAVDASLIRGEEEDVWLPTGTIRAERVTLDVNGTAGNVFWCLDSEAVKSDWQGAESYRAATEIELFDGLPDPVADLTRDFRLRHGW